VLLKTNLGFFDGAFFKKGNYLSDKILILCFNKTMSLQIPENLVQKIGRLFDVRGDEADFITTGEDPQARQESVKMKNQVNITVEGASPHLGPELRSLIQDVRLFLAEMSHAFGQALTEIIDQYQQEGISLGQSLALHLKEKHLIPRFTVMVGQNRQAFLDQFKELRPYQLASQSVLVIFNLPKPLDYWWHKGGNDIWGQPNSNATNQMAVEYGKMYRLVMPTVWQQRDQIDQYRLECNRVNPINYHQYGKFYYVWEIGRGKGEA